MEKRIILKIYYFLILKVFEYEIFLKSKKHIFKYILYILKISNIKSYN